MIDPPITSSEVEWRYCVPPNTRSKVLLLTRAGVATIGSWGNGVGVIAWVPLPRRDKKLESRL